MKHCIITEEYAGLNKSGGIGSCARGLAELLVKTGHSVDLLITDLSYPAIGPSDVRHPNGLRFISLSDVSQADKTVASHFDSISKAFSVYRYLKQQDYAVIRRAKLTP
jgi:glycogen synthase